MHTISEVIPTGTASSGHTAFMTQVQEGQIVPLVQFGGAGVVYWDELRAAYHQNHSVRSLLQSVAGKLTSVANSKEAQTLGYLTYGLDLQSWLEDSAALPPSEYLFLSAISQPLTFMTHVSCVMRLQSPHNGVDSLLQRAAGFFGHSQGVMTSICFSHGYTGAAFTELVTNIAVYLFWQGLRMVQAYPPARVAPRLIEAAAAAGDGVPGPMASITGFEPHEMEAVLGRVNARLGNAQAIHLSLINAWNRMIVSGPAESLVVLRSVLLEQERRWQKEPVGRRPLAWEYVKTSGPFHSPYMQPLLATFREDLERYQIRFRAQDLQCPVYGTELGDNLQQARDLTTALIEMQWIKPVNWPLVCRKASARGGITHIVDCGPGDGIAKLTAKNRSGGGVAVIAAGNSTGQAVLLSHDPSVIPTGEDWGRHRPRLTRVQDQLWLDNNFSRFTKFPPIFGGGMTPTSVETEIVTAAANAGYLQEWAGGGQVTEAIWRERCAELRRDLLPGRGVVFNALFLDPYLWRLHFPKIIELKKEGVPLLGMTISAGVPDVEQAVQIFQQLRAAGMWLNALKPGSDAQITQCLKIAAAQPEHALLLHLEGGKAGGHHSWEDLRALLLRNYARLRAQSNVILCVGGGIATPEQAASWLYGDWHGHPDLAPMPVDAVFLGTRLMACQEAKTSPQVKDFLVKLAGTKDWVRPLETKGGITSQKSPLDADVHFAVNAAAKAGALLDRLAGQPREVILAQRDEIIALLNQTCKPYFGDLADMTYAAVLERMIALMAPGKIVAHLPHDGSWYDETFRARAFQWAQRIEARLRGETADEAWVLIPQQLDGPAAFLKALVARYPRAATLTLHPEDVEYFLYLCRLPGKPVNFVPVIDENVRRWYKADSLWQSHDPRYPVEAVYTIPGPEAVRGITKANEPIAEIFADFSHAVVARLQADPHPRAVRGTRSEYPALSYAGEAAPTVSLAWRALPVDVTTQRTKEIRRVIVPTDATPASWCAWLASQGHGPLRAFLLAPDWWMEHRYQGNRAAGILRAQPGETWQVECVGEQLTRIVGPAMTLQSRGDQIECLIHHTLAGETRTITLHLPFSYRPECGQAPIQADEAEHQRRVREFYQAIWPTRTPVARTALRVGATFDGTTTVSRAAIQAYVAAVGEHLAAAPGQPARWQAPPMMSIMHAWEPFAQTLLACSYAGHLFHLLHASYGYRLRTTTPIVEGDRLTTALTITQIESRPQGVKITVRGDIRKGKQVLVEIDSAFFVRGGRAELASAAPAGEQVPSATSPAECRLPSSYQLFESALQYPPTAQAYALASGDRNPIHVDARVAALAGLSVPIMHGMWSAAVLARECAHYVADGEPARVTAVATKFVRPITPGASAEIRAQHVAMRAGAQVLDVELQSQGETVCVARAEVAPPRTAYLFTGQGAQTKGMGMIAYQRSGSARAIWERAERFCRTSYGFSLLAIVQQNPTRLQFSGPDGVVQSLFHPQGVLQLTQFTQVALTVMEMAGIAELKEAGCFVSEAMFAGHSLGEYAALSAVEILPFEQVLAMVYHRGLTMQHYVPRDAHGVSPYRMAAVRPNIVGMDEATLQALVATLTKDGGALEIVNYNIDSEQYAVTGHVGLLEALERHLAAQAQRVGASKPPLIWLEGIDVPFHSTVLRDGVAAFRKTLSANMPETLDAQYLVGRYIPNLNAQPFAIDRAYVAAVAKQTGSPILRDLLKQTGGKAWQPARVARSLLIELLAYQFASPVQWIATQRLLLDDPTFAVARVIEIGPQPVLANMFRRTVQRAGIRRRTPQLYHIEADRQAVFYLLQESVLTSGCAAPPPPAKPAEPPPHDRGVEPGSTPTDITPRPAAADIVAPISTADVLPDAPFSVAESLRDLLALKLRLRPDEIALTDTIEKLTGGNSARRNEVLADLGAEFNVGAIDDAHNKPLTELIETLASQSKYRQPGPYFRVATDQAIKGALPINRAAVLAYLQTTYVLGEGRLWAVLTLLPLAVREGESNGTGTLSPCPLAQRCSDAVQAQGWLDRVVEWYGSLHQITVARRQSATATGGAMVDSQALQTLEAKYFGREGLLGRVAQELMTACGVDPYAPVLAQDEELLAMSREHALYRRALGPAFEQVAAPQFDARRVVTFSSTWNWAKRDVVAAYWQLRRGEALAEADIARIARQADETTLRTIQYFVRAGASPQSTTVRTTLRRLEKAVQSSLAQAPRFLPDGVPVRPVNLQMATGWTVSEQVRPEEPDWAAMIARLAGAQSSLAPYGPALAAAATNGVSLAGRCVVITGASPGSIAAEIAQFSLRAGAQVVVSVSRLTEGRVRWWREVYQQQAARGAQLHVMPASQGSQEDCEQLIAWASAQCGRIDALYPFGAVRELGDLTTMQADASTATWRVLVQGIEWLIAAVARQNAVRGVPLATTIILPGSPNHGQFGGDGAYGAAKAALEVLTNRWRSEQAAWGQWVRLIGARIGWTRGTGLMQANDLLAALLEARTGCRTFATREMAVLLTALLHEDILEQAKPQPLWLDFTGGFERIPDMGALARELREELQQKAAAHVATTSATSSPVADFPATAESVSPKADPEYFAFPSLPTTQQLAALPTLAHLDPRDVYVVVGYGEVSPYGSARTRWAAEQQQGLSVAACIELAWISGRVKFESGTQYVGWVEAASGEPIGDQAIKTEFEAELLAESGLRAVNSALLGYDTQALRVWSDVQLEQDLVIPVESETEAAKYVTQYPGQAEFVRVPRADGQGDGFGVRLHKGAVIKIPRTERLTRAVAGQVPTGWDATRYGLEKDLVNQVDRTTAFNLVASAEAFLTMGMSPDELSRHLHPTRIANAQGSGMGGQHSLDRLYHDYREDRSRKGDILQESLINVTAAWVNQSLVGGYGPTVHPVGACATAVVSLDLAVNLLASDKADFVVVGGYDDCSAEGAQGFSDMDATADTDEMAAQGMTPRAMSRPNDRRRGGFMEAQGGGTQLVTRLSHAVALGLPIYAVVAMTATHADGLHTSIPAPGLGLLAIARGGADSPLGRALQRFGLTADDIAVVSKHDTSTTLNDPNENRLHQQLQSTLGRSPGHPLVVHSQKALLGHAKGGAGAWQANAAIQMLQTGIVPGNPNLDDVDPAMQEFNHLCFTDRALVIGPRQLRAVIYTSLGFGHVGAAALFLHPDYALRIVSDADRARYAQQRAVREAWYRQRGWAALLGQTPMFARRTAQVDRDEIQWLLNG